MDFDFGTGTNRVYNFISLGFIVAAILACIGTLLFLLLGGGGNDNSGISSQALPTGIVIPTATPSDTPTITLTPLAPSFTPTNVPSETPRPTMTFTPTFTTSPTLSATPTITMTTLPSETATETATFLPTLGTPPPSPSPYLFALQTDISYTSNLNASGCAWQGIGGQVLDLNGNAYGNTLTINITGGGLPQALTGENGDNSLYGPGGYEVQLANSINTQTYNVQLVTPLGTAVSEIFQVSFPGTCEGNLALVTFKQTRPN